MESLDGKDFQPRPTFKMRDFDDNVYNIKLFIPARVGIMIAEMEKRLTALKGEGRNIDEESMGLVFNILSEALSKQFPHMTRDWVEKNIDFNDAMDMLDKFMGFHNNDISSIRQEHSGKSGMPVIKNPMPKRVKRKRR